ncbi:Probable cytochrome P450 4s3 [Sergentomyia squamirostris]
MLTKFRNFKRILDFSYTVPGPSFIALFRKKSEMDYLTWIMVCRKNYGKRFAAWLGKELYLYITVADDVKDILSSPNLLHKAEIRKLIEPWLGQGLLISGAAKWSKNRKLLTPAFHFNILKLYQKSMEECSDILVKKLSEVADERPVDIQAYSTLFALDVICETAMGVRMNVQENDNAEYVKAVRIICEIIRHRAFSMLLRIPLYFKMSSYRKRQDDALNVIHGQTRRVLELRRKKLMNDNITMDDILGKDDNGIGRMKGKLAFLDLLLLSQREGNDLTDENIREEVDTFMFEGHDTVSSALAFAIYELSQHSEIQEQVYQEAVEFEGHESEFMKYLEAVIKETLRLYPSVPVFSRRTTENTKIGDLIVPPGVNMSISAYTLHRNPDVFTDPDTFNPERFINGTDIPNYAYVPFSAGPRNCIGQKFAMIELKVTLSKILRHFKLIPVSGYKPILSSFVTLKSVNGLQVGFKKRC